MKKLFRTIIAAMLCAIIAISAFGTDAAYAAETAKPLKVTFNKKTVTLTKDMEAGVKTVNIKNLTKKWGNPTETPDQGYTIYGWKKGKTTIEYGKADPGISFKSWIEIEIEDKNAAILGVKVGMKKKAAVKKLKSAGGTLTVGKGYLHLMTDSKISVNCTVKKGKITSIFSQIYPTE